MKDNLEIGLIVKPQGVRGELKVMPLTDNPNRFKKIKTVYIDNKSFSVLGVKISPDAVFVALSGINDRNSAELFRNKYISIKREGAVEISENSFFITDLENSKVFVDDKLFGEVIEVISAKTDYIAVKTLNNKIVRFPFLKRIIKNVDIENGCIYLIKEKFDEVACYED